MTIDVQKVENIAEALLGVASQFVPGANIAADVILVKKLLAAGKDLNALLSAIKNQTDGNAADVWAAVVADGDDAVAAWEASVAAHPGS